MPDAVQSIDQEDVPFSFSKLLDAYNKKKEYMQVQIEKYKLLKDLPHHEAGEIWEVRIKDYISPVVFIQHPMGHKSEAQSWVYGFLNENRENSEWFTPLIESEVEMLEEDGASILNKLISNGRLDVSLLAIYLAKQNRAINALQKGSK